MYRSTSPENLHSLAKLALDLSVDEVDLTDVSDDLALLPGLLTDLGKILVPLGESLEVFLFALGVGEDVGDEGLGRDGGVALWQGRSGGDESGENGELSRDVGTGKVVSRVRFLVSSVRVWAKSPNL